MKKLLQILNLGRMTYQKAHKIQTNLAHLHLNTPKNQDTLIFVEHNPVYTVGLRDKTYTSADERRLTALGAEFHRTNRGGLITFHGPGQLVVYPVINLKHYKLTVRKYVEHIEETVIRMCADLAIAARTTEHTGVWVGDNKIAAIGIHASRHVTTHGLAINCNVDFAWYKHIVACGIPDKGVTSISMELGREFCVDECIPRFLDAFRVVFDVEEVRDFDTGVLDLS